MDAERFASFLISLAGLDEGDHNDRLRLSLADRLQQAGAATSTEVGGFKLHEVLDVLEGVSELEELRRGLQPWAYTQLPEPLRAVVEPEDVSVSLGSETPGSFSEDTPEGPAVIYARGDMTFAQREALLTAAYEARLAGERVVIDLGPPAEFR